MDSGSPINRRLFCDSRLNLNSTVMTTESVDRAVAALAGAVEELSSVFLEAAIESAGQVRRGDCREGHDTDKLQ